MTIAVGVGVRWPPRCDRGVTDTVAAVAGALLGARYGCAAVPVVWEPAVHGWPGRGARRLGALDREARGSRGHELHADEARFGGTVVWLPAGVVADPDAERP